MNKIINEYNSNVTISEDKTRRSYKMEKELDKRYKIVLANPDEGKSWDEVKARLLKR